MQPELLPTPQLDETEEKLNVRIEKLYRIYGQNWRPFFERTERSDDEAEGSSLLPRWVLDLARQQSETVSPKRESPYNGAARP